jgi:hypothetical protein
MDACIKEREKGVMDDDWEHFGHIVYIKNAPNVNYTCVHFNKKIRLLNWSAPNKYNYLLTISGSAELTLEPFDSYAACLGKIREQGGTETKTRFCGRSSQATE